MPRVALITGGVSGIGAATAQMLKASGYMVVANYFGNEPDAVNFQRKTGIPVRCWDVSDFEATQTQIGRIASEFGAVEVLVNGAGITRDGTLHKMSPDQWRDVLKIDLGGCFNTCRAVISDMRERRFGRIVNISSVNALSGQFGQTNYAAAKAGIIGFTKSLALEGAARGITVNAIAPGYSDTDMVRAVPARVLEGIIAGVPVGRLARPEEIARSIAFLVSDQAGFITGATLSVNGGKYMA